MCGITGALSAKGQSPELLRQTIDAMRDSLVHRGPDDSGTWLDAEGQCGLGFRRLSILDLSPNGHQPMRSRSGRYTVIFNGELYNHFELRRDLEKCGYTFRGHSDTETLCAGIEQWGLRATIVRCIGMFAIAVWDDATKTLSLARDRLGIKPLYIYRRPGLLLFASELKAFKRHPMFEGNLDVRSVEMFLRYLYIPAPATIFQNAEKVQPGSIVTVTLPDCAPLTEPYWSLQDAYDRGRRDPFKGGEPEAIAALEEVLSDAVQLRKLSDVPLGALLSGGIDSTTVVALMQRGSALPTRTFSIGFTSKEHDESKHAARIAAYLGTDHTELMLDGTEALDVVPQMPFIFDEPFADPSQIPTYLVCQLARRDVTVALTGDGGDEVFGGYHRYIQGHRFIASLSQIPRPARRLASVAFGKLSSDWYPLVAPVARATGQRLANEKLGKISRMLAADSSSAMYRSLLSAWQNPVNAMMLTDTASPDPVERALLRTNQIPLLERMMLVDQATYLTDDLLAKVDRASMAVSLEARVPLLDHRVIELAWRMPADWKVRGGEGKWLLRQVLYRHVPREMVDRPKVGFSVPIDEWLRGPLRSWAEQILIEVDSPLSRDRVLGAWSDFQRGKSGLGLSIWAIVMLQAWRLAWQH